VPADLVTASGSGLDPDLSPAAALAQAPRIARVRGVPVERVRALVTNATDASILGEPHVSVLALNRALDALSASGAPAR
jgi:K+-transporting ATPase ATPase C chain